MRVLFIADIFASAGRRAVEKRLPGLREELDLDLVVANAENAADGVGVTSRIAGRLLAAGVDAITLGNHAFRQREVYPYLDQEPRIIRPANLSAAAPGRGMTTVQTKDGTPVAVLNLMGQLFLDTPRSPFEVATDLAAEARNQAAVVLVDFHAEATSEKVAMGWHLDGRVTACVGTHTHVPTADGRVLPGGTAFITDVGMTGARGGVIGADREHALRRFMTATPVKLETATEDPWLMGVLVEADEAGRATGIQQLLEPAQ
ncbi:MAG: 2,3-cyclic-nucleotide 2-phosphodiesterase [Gaiellales bacterium]|nr:2,3-cyclic-nucleotide 2-phosphodiesterase [Gaiellales bacterium]